ncbi:hypothetical protein OVA14_04095 [Agrococcus sp. SL85]|uniref:hypothetical protein n=1 Tax=Agrococcus sp. SL85 TaxID=2995141 RepID=UPI00226D0363|nr:hypothetical protein [Agrococcus sp. SL85]WAC66955.1 hypothetical protein OVA14_04095 [Agrococcus sp. SL85]
MSQQSSAFGAQQAPPAAQPPSADRSAQPGPTPARPAPRRIMGVQPVLLVGICLLAIVSIVTVVLIFIGDFESQAARVVWTVVVFLAFTALLAIDLVLARRSSTPLVIGVAANTYLLAVLMVAIWVRSGGTAEPVDEYDLGSGWLFAELFGIVLLTIVVVRTAAAAAWGLIILGRRARAAFARVVGLVASALVGLVGVLLTLHFAIDAFGLDVGEWYWRSTVAAVVIAALASSITVLLFWNRRNLDWQEAEARGEHAAARAAGPVAPPMQVVATPAPVATAAWPQVPQPDAQGRLPWPTYADGTPLPMGPDGQPLFPRR